MKFKDQVVLITGGGRGIGAATASRFASEGARVVVSDLDLSPAEEVAKPLQGLAIACDVTDRVSVEAMVGRKSGKMVFLSSTSALGNRGQTNYSTAKAGLQGMARTLAIELGPFNINVNTVAPGFIETRMTRATAERMGVDFEAFKVGAASQIPLGRIGQPEDVAAVIAFLCSEDASFISGQTIYVRGGP